MILKTYDEWRMMGFQVKKGEVGAPSKRKDSEPLFSDTQVKEIRSHVFNLGLGEDEPDYD